MGESFVLGIDLGTGSCKTCLVDTSGRLSGRGSSYYRTHLPREGWAEQDPADWLAAAVGSIRAVLVTAEVEPQQVIGLSLTSAAHIGVLTDTRGAPVRRAILWSDQRSAEQVREISPEAADLIFERTRNGISTTWTLPHLLWIRKREPREWERMERLLLSKDYLLNRLTGECCTDRATAVSSMLYDTEAEAWSEQLCSLAGIDPRSLPAVWPATHVAGRLLPELAAETGLAAGLPVVNGTLDSATETYCAGAVADGDVVVRLGTAGGIHRVSHDARPARELITYPYVVSPLWYTQAGTNSAGSAVAWSLHALGGRWPLSNDELTALAANAAPGCEGLLFHPYLAGERCPYWDERLRGTFTGLSMRHGPTHLARAVLESVCYSLKDAASLFGDLGPQHRTVRVVGGGTANSLWTRILCDVLARPLAILPNASSAYGAALLGLSALGAAVRPDAAAVQDSLGHDGLEPDTSNVRIYEAAFRRYRCVSGQLRELYRESGTGDARTVGVGKA